MAGVEGVERNTSYRRIDDRSREDHAELEIKKQVNAGEGELICMKTDGIHSVHNDTDTLTLSLHTYGKHVNYTNRSQFDLESHEKRNFVVRVD